uniref:Uncharacterized protein n=2 Tax=Ditylenchus dipsaci TaxID=166011 RepID=A0A915E2R2_9BILA
MANKSPIENFIAGGVGGALKITISHPLDTIKVRLQTMPIATDGFYSYLRKMIASEGFLALYKGISVPLIAGVPFSASYFGGCAFGRWLLQEEQSTGSFVSNFFIGGISGGFTSLIAAPLDRVKALLQVQSNVVKPRYRGPFHASRKLFREGGVPNLYQGFSVTLLRGFLAGASYFSVYALLKKIFSAGSDADNRSSAVTIMISGGTAGVIVGLLGLPLDVLKSRLQTAPIGRYPRGIRDVLKEIRREGRMRSTLFRGWVPVLGLFPSNAVCFLGIETTVYLLDLRK